MSPTPAAGNGTPTTFDDAELRRQAWTHYWASGALHSCAGSFEGNYAGTIREFWHRVFAALPDQATVLDLCCGNAPLAQMLLEMRPTSAIEVDGVDAAAVAPEWIGRQPEALRRRVRIHAGVDAAALPFADASMDLCASQYGIEYVGAGAVAEVARVLRPGGRFAAVMHHPESLPVRIAREDLDHLAWLDRSQGLFAATAAMLRPMAASATAEGREQLRSDTAAEAARKRFNEVQAEMDERMASSRWPDVLHDARIGCGAALERARTGGEAAGEEAFAQMRKDIDELALRDRELIAFALDEPGLRALLAPLGEPELGVLRFDTGDIAGWSVEVQAP